MTLLLVIPAAIVLATILGAVIWTMAQDGWWVPVLCFGVGILGAASLYVVLRALGTQ